MTQPPRGLALMLAAMTAVGPFSIDAYLPAFPGIAAGLGATPLEVQQTLTAFLVPFAFMMLWHGALADALGRRRVLLGALAIFVAASLLCTAATRIEHLWLGRALQGLSSGAGMVVARAVIRDLLDGPPAQRLIAHTGMIFAIAPVVAPLVGGWLQHFFAWQSIFLFLAAYGALIFAAVWAWLPETLPPDRRQSLHPADLARAYATVLGHPPFLKLALALALNFVAFFIYVLASPVFLIDHLGVSAQGFLWLFGPAMAGMLAGNFLAGRLAGHGSGARTVKGGLAIMLVAATGNVLLNLAMAPQLPWAVLPLALYVFGMSLTVPTISLRILDLFPERRGLASSCQGATQTTINALAAGLLVPLVWGSTLSLALTMAAALALGLLALACCQPVRRAPPGA